MSHPDLDDFAFDADDGWLEQARDAEREPVALGSIGEYELLEERGRGGQGVVWKARQPRTGRIIAVKRMLAGSFATVRMRKRFEREVLAAASLNHPGIVTVFGFDLVDGQPVLAMEWVEGVPCTQAVSADDPDSAIEIGLRISDAVSHAHERGIVHRDLKPSNVLVDEAGEPHLLDFGLAKRTCAIGATEDALTGSAEVLGTPAYAAPEQLRAGALGTDERTDVYSLGVVLYEMLTGARPYPGPTTIVEQLQAVESRPPVRPSKCSSRLDARHDAVLLRAMHADPAGRYSSVRALAEDLRRLLAGLPVGAIAPTRWDPLHRFVVRNKALSGLAAALVLVSFAFAGISTWQARDLRRTNADLEATIERLNETRIDLEHAESVVTDPPAWVRDQADQTVKDYLPPCLVEPQATLNFDHVERDYDEDIWSDG